MAKKKPKTPPPPRKVQAPKQRSTTSRDAGGRNRTVLYVAAGIAIAAVIVAGALRRVRPGEQQWREAGRLADGRGGLQLQDRHRVRAARAGRARPQPDEEAPVEHGSALERPALPALGGLGLLHRAGQPADGRAQRGARRRDPLVGDEGAGVDGRPAARLLQRADRRHVRHAVSRSSAARSRSARGPGTPPSTAGTTTSAKATSRSAPGSTRRRSRRSRPSARPTAATARKASRSRSTSREWARSRELDSTRRAGVAKRVNAPGLKPGVPSRDVGVRLPPPALHLRSAGSLGERAEPGGVLGRQRVGVEAPQPVALLRSRACSCAPPTRGRARPAPVRSRVPRPTSTRPRAAPRRIVAREPGPRPVRVGEACPPAGGGVVVVRARVDDRLLDVVSRQVRAVGIAADRELQHDHPREAELRAQPANGLGDHAEILGDHVERAEHRLGGLEHGGAGAATPAAVGRRRAAGGNGPVRHEPAKVVDPREVDEPERAPESFRPPPVALPRAARSSRRAGFARAGPSPRTRPGARPRSRRAGTTRGAHADRRRPTRRRSGCRRRRECRARPHRRARNATRARTAPGRRGRRRRRASRRSSSRSRRGIAAARPPSRHFRGRPRARATRRRRTATCTASRCGRRGRGGGPATTAAPRRAASRRSGRRGDPVPRSAATSDAGGCPRHVRVAFARESHAWCPCRRQRSRHPGSRSRRSSLSSTAGASPSSALRASGSTSTRPSSSTGTTSSAPRCARGRRRARCARSRSRISATIASAGRSWSIAPAAGRSRSWRGPTGSRRGSTSCAARSRPVSSISPASSPRARRSSTVRR